ncbi:exo-beta-N-acetylmuramidase NamZ domain-containing protein [Negadavirga shengliensis]|uniref:Exo-beta-N-acetylmuramidase NamZ domain-containing protein n=1 Tax=Negadavirga shengliensis TaxID=1389218 RepID=A0ABV9T5B4_9BACT
MYIKPIFQAIFMIWGASMLGAGCQSKSGEASKTQVPSGEPISVTVGAERLFEPEYFSLIEGKKLALVTNHTGLLPDGRHLVDILYGNEKLDLKLLFGPEHGIRGEEDTHVADGKDKATGLPVISLYGKVRKPNAEMLADIDVILFDIQDIGARFYTYIATMNHVLEAAAEQGIPFVVLDRPNAIGGIYVDGPVGKKALEPVIGVDQLPVVHGMTVGELALMFNEEREKAGLPKAQLTVVPMKDYQREKWYDQTGLPWIKPSPNMLTLTTATIYPMTCLLEGTNLSEGRGTLSPFEHIGAPWVDGEKLASQLNAYGLNGVEFSTSQFIPESVVDGIKIYPPKFLGDTCYSAEIRVTDRNAFESVKAAVYMLEALHRLYPQKLEWREPRMDGLWKTDAVRKSILAEKPAEKIIQDWGNGLTYFKKTREQYLLY